MSLVNPMTLRVAQGGYSLTMESKISKNINKYINKVAAKHIFLKQIWIATLCIVPVFIYLCNRNIYFKNVVLERKLGKYFFLNNFVD